MKRVVSYLSRLPHSQPRFPIWTLLLPEPVSCPGLSSHGLKSERSKPGFKEWTQGEGVNSGYHEPMCAEGGVRGSRTHSAACLGAGAGAAAGTPLGHLLPFSTLGLLSWSPAQWNVGMVVPHLTACSPSSPGSQEALY